MNKLDHLFETGYVKYCPICNQEMTRDGDLGYILYECIKDKMTALFDRSRDECASIDLESPNIKIFARHKQKYKITIYYWENNEDAKDNLSKAISIKASGLKRNFSMNDLISYVNKVIIFS